MVKYTILRNKILLLILVFLMIIPVQGQIKERYEIASNITKPIEIVINQSDKSLEISFTCVGCEINFKFLDNENYQKFITNQSFNSRLTLNNWETYSNKIFIPFTGSWWIIIENIDSFNKTVNLSYQLVDPPVTEDWIFWVILIPWIGGFFLIVTVWFYKKRKK
ncbi:MAG: hypothetical protein ACW981_10760 [Candidatus Hodarchaeales archaeon]